MSRSSPDEPTWLATFRDLFQRQADAEPLSNMSVNGLRELVEKLHSLDDQDQYRCLALQHQLVVCKRQTPALVKFFWDCHVDTDLPIAAPWMNAMWECDSSFAVQAAG